MKKIISILVLVNLFLIALVPIAHAANQTVNPVVNARFYLNNVKTLTDKNNLENVPPAELLSTMYKVTNWKELDFTPFSFEAHYLNWQGDGIVRPVYGFLHNDNLYIDVDSFKEILKPDFFFEGQDSNSAMKYQFMKGDKEIEFIEYTYTTNILTNKSIQQIRFTPEYLGGSIFDNKVTFIPLRAVSEGLGLAVEYNPGDKHNPPTVEIKS